MKTHIKSIDAHTAQMWLAVISACIILLLGIIIFRPHTKYYYIDIDKVLSHMSIKLSNAQNLEQEIAYHKRYFAQRLDAYSKEKNAVIFSTPRVLAGAEDITEIFVKLIISYEHTK